MQINDDSIVVPTLSCGPEIVDWSIKLPTFSNDDISIEMVNSTEYAAAFVLLERSIIVDPVVQA